MGSLLEPLEIDAAPLMIFILAQWDTFQTSDLQKCEIINLF